MIPVGDQVFISPFPFILENGLIVKGISIGAKMTKKEPLDKAIFLFP